MHNYYGDIHESIICIKLHVLFKIRINDTFAKYKHKCVFKTDIKIGKKKNKKQKKKKRSPYHLGTLLWNRLDKTVQESPDIYASKTSVARLYKCYNERYVEHVYLM